MLHYVSQSVLGFGPGGRESKGTVEISSLMHWLALGPKTPG